METETEMEMEMDRVSVRCCIAGGGPAGMMLGLLLAQAGIEVLVLDKHADFLRDFRGDTIYPSTLAIMHELGRSAVETVASKSAVDQCADDHRVLAYQSFGGNVYYSAILGKLKQEVAMKIPSILTAKSLALAGGLIFSIASMGAVQARKCDMSDSIAAGDSAAVRDTDCEPKDGEKKQRATSRMSSDSKRDNSRYSTDGIERYQEGNDRDEGYSGTGPRREGRY